MRHSDRIKSGEVWFAELGMIEKSRPVLALAAPGSEHARGLVIPTLTRGAPECFRL